jgi:hypothetical protein
MIIFFIYNNIRMSKSLYSNNNVIGSKSLTNNSNTSTSQNSFIDKLIDEALSRTSSNLFTIDNIVVNTTITTPLIKITNIISTLTIDPVQIIATSNLLITAPILNINSNVNINGTLTVSGSSMFDDLFITNNSTLNTLSTSSLATLDSLLVINNSTLNTLSTSSLATLDSLSITNNSVLNNINILGSMNMSFNIINLVTDVFDFTKMLNIINFPIAIPFTATTDGMAIIIAVFAASSFDTDAFTTLLLTNGYTYTLVFYNAQWNLIMKSPNV